MVEIGFCGCVLVGTATPVIAAIVAVIVALQIVRIAQALRPMLIFRRGRTIEILRRSVSGTRCVSSPLLGFLNLQPAHRATMLSHFSLHSTIAAVLRCMPLHQASAAV